MINEFLSTYRKIILALLVLLSVFLICFRFTTTPKVWVDEGIFTNIAENVAQHGVFGHQSSPGKYFLLGPLSSVNYPVIYPIALSLKIFGNGIWQARLPMIIYMMLLVVAFYVFARKKYGEMVAIGAVMLLVTFAPFYGNGRSVLGEVPGLFYLVLGAFYLLKLEQGQFGERKYAEISGILLGLAAATKSLYLLVLCFSVPLISVLFYRRIPNKRNLFLMLGLFILPVIVWFLVNCPTIDAMKQFVPTLAKQAGNNGASSLSGTSHNTIETILVNFRRFFSESTPILFMLSFVTVLFSYISKYIKRIEVTMAEYLLLLIVVCNWAGYLIGTGWYRYFFPAHVLVYLLLPGSVSWLRTLFEKKWVRSSMLIALILLVAFQFVHLIFVSDVNVRSYRTRNDELAAAISPIPPTKKILFYNAVEAIVFLKTDQYYQYQFMPGLYENGEKSWIRDSSFDYILVSNMDDAEALGLKLSCYEKTSVDKYFFYQKKATCKK